MKVSTFLLAATVLLSTGCAGRYAILTVPAISMTKTSFSNTAKPSGHVDAEFCSGDDPMVSKDNNVGLIDEAVAKAQQQAGNADYLKDVTVWASGRCVAVEGTAMK